MRTKTIARLRRGILSGTLALALAAPAQQNAAQPDPTQPAPADQQAAPAPADQQQPAAQQAPQQAPPAKNNETAPVVTEQSPRPPPDADIKPVPGTPEEYVIQRGDTLWDLSQKFLNNPWYWPKIWSNNPYIENPHWIYPGNKLKIVPGEGGAQAPAQVQQEPQPEAGVDATAQNAPAEEAPAAEPTAENNVTPPASPDLDVVSKGSSEGNAALNSVSASGKLAFSPPPVISVKPSGLVSPEEMTTAGTLESSFEEKEMLSTYDTAYARFKTEVPVKPGDKLLSFHPVGDIVDPVTHRKLATQTVTTGVLKVLSIQGQQVVVQVEKTYEEISRGDMVRPWVAQQKRITPKANTADVSGVVVQGVNSDIGTLGESNEVFINKGSADGVQEGNTFAVVRNGDGLNERAVTESYTGGGLGAVAPKGPVPDENVGLLLVVDTTEHLSTAVVVKSVREIQKGDLVQMHPSGAGGG
ncbi:MAG TPA: LysM peptidoglycan-binding domain-containing protein [Myxococcales bacterium]|nr:LysM peptidoglycan-binding domain-containing protein [Myxococcales bacterium]